MGGKGTIGGASCGQACSRTTPAMDLLLRLPFLRGRDPPGHLPRTSVTRPHHRLRRPNDRAPPSRPVPKSSRRCSATASRATACRPQAEQQASHLVVEPVQGCDSLLESAVAVLVHALLRSRGHARQGAGRVRLVCAEQMPQGEHPARDGARRSTIHPTRCTP